MRGRTAQTLTAALILALAACGGNGEEEAESPRPARSAGCAEAETVPARTPSLSAPAQTVSRGEPLTALVETSCGTFEIGLDTRRAPRTVNSFVFLARRGFYDGLAFHRIAPGFVIQGGDPLGDGTGGPGYFVDEQPPPNLEYTRGLVAMAKTQAEPPGRSGSQFFVVLPAAIPLPPHYALLGRVRRGMAVVDRIGRLGTATEQPARTVVIESVAIEAR